jgi:gliding motility-associated lipoprotein GldD
MTYAPVHGNLHKLLSDADKLTYKHAVKADNFQHKIYEDPSRRVFGRLSLVSGNAASPLQFLVTDSTRHFVTGSLYFRAVPNYDSIRPPLEYIRRDVEHMLETWHWKH